MATRYNPKIVTDGLAFCVDWSNPRCYQGAVGTEAWNDISLNPVGTNGHNQSSGDGPTYTSDGNVAYYNYTRSNTERHRTTESGGASILSKMGHSGSGVSAFPYSIEALFRLTSLPVSNSTADRFTIIGNTEVNKGFGIQVRNNGTNVQLQIGARNRGSHTIQEDLVTNKWYHAVIARDGAADLSATINFYMNGVLINTRDGSGRAVVDYPSNTTVQIGHGGSATGAMDGDIALVRIYSKQLSTSEVAQNYNALKGRFGL